MDRDAKILGIKKAMQYYAWRDAKSAHEQNQKRTVRSNEWPYSERAANDERAVGSYFSKYATPQCIAYHEVGMDAWEYCTIGSGHDCFASIQPQAPTQYELWLTAMAEQHRRTEQPIVSPRDFQFAMSYAYQYGEYPCIEFDPDDWDHRYTCRYGRGHDCLGAAEPKPDR